MITIYDATQAGEAAAFSTPEPRAIIFDGAQFVVRTGDDLPYVAPVIPDAVTMRQARLALLDAGVLADVDSAISAMTGHAGDAARIEWEYAQEVMRSSALVATLGATLGLDAAALDALFATAAGL